MNSIVINAPAKINLFLKVIDKRPDGYHDIVTLFEKIALFDRIILRKRREGISIYSENTDLPKDGRNLAYRAAALMADRCGAPLGVRIEIEKSIPIGAGLGGGSSDAAAVLTGMNKLYNLGLTAEDLSLLAKELGADVPFFLSEKAWAVGRERGDKIEGLDTQLNLWHLLVIPPFKIASNDAYEWIDENLGCRDTEIEKALSALREGDIGLLGSSLYNDLEGIALERDSRLKGIKDILVESGARGALISGSGPALFGIVEKKKEVTELRERIREEVVGRGKGWQIFAIQTYNEEEN